MSHPRTRRDFTAHTPAPVDPEAQRQAQELETRALTAEEATEFARTLAIGTPDHEALQARVAPGMSRTDVRNAMLEVMVARQNEAPTFPHVEVRGMGNENIRAALADAIMVRVNPGHKPQNDAREFVGMSLVEIARECLERSGQSGRGHAHDVVQRGLHSSSDYSAVLGDVAHTVLAGAYTASPSPLKALARQVSVKDFREKTTARLSEFSDLQKVNEAGEYSRGSYQEGSESYRVEKYGKTFALTLELLVNDQLGAFTNIARDIGATVARLEADLLAKAINDNSKMKNGKGVFHADHKNLAGTGAALSETSLSAARLAVMKQTGIAGELIDIHPRFLVVAPELQTGAEKLLASVQATTVDDVNPFAGRLQLVVDRRLAANAWYLAADPAQAESLEIAYIAGMESPDIRSREGFDVDGMEFRVRHIVGVGWTDYRAWYKNPGQ